MGRGGKSQGGLVARSMHITVSLGKGFKRQRHRDYGKRYLGMCLVAEPEHHPASLRGSCTAPFPCWELQGAPSHVPSLCCISDSFKITIIIAKPQPQFADSY